MRRRPKTPEELRTDLKDLEAAWKREMAQFMRNAVERMMTPGSGRRIPAKYKMKLPRLFRTVPIPSLRPAPSPSKIRRRSRLVAFRRVSRKESSPKSGKNRRRQVAENLQIRLMLANAVERMEAFHDRRPMPAPLEMTFFGSPEVKEQARAYQDSVRSASDKLLKHLRNIHP
jgi:hypothetical protein